MFGCCWFGCVHCGFWNLLSLVFFRLCAGGFRIVQVLVVGDCEGRGVQCYCLPVSVNGRVWLLWRWVVVVSLCGWEVGLCGCFWGRDSSLPWKWRSSLSWRNDFLYQDVGVLMLWFPGYEWLESFGV